MEDQKPLEGENKPAELKRHGFITFWLWLMVIANGATGVITLFNLGKDYLDSTGMVLIVFSGALSLANMYAAIRLLGGKKAGFWLFVGVAVLNIVLTLISAATYDVWEGNLRGIIGSVLGPVILYLILGLKKDNVSYWSQLQ